MLYLLHAWSFPPLSASVWSALLLRLHSSCKYIFFVGVAMPGRLNYPADLACLQVGLVKRYGDAEAVSGLLNLVRLELGMSPDTHFTQASLTAVLCYAVLCCAVLCCAELSCVALCCGMCFPTQLSANLPLTAFCLP